MEKLNVICDSCKVGKLVCLGLVHDDYTVGCDNCKHVFTTHYTGYDCLLEESEYNNNVCEDVQILNANGSFSNNQTHGVNYFKKQHAFNLAEYTKNMKHIQTIETYELLHYYQNGGSFVMIAENEVHSTFAICEYKAKEANIPALMNHFFGVKA